MILCVDIKSPMPVVGERFHRVQIDRLICDSCAYDYNAKISYSIVKYAGVGGVKKKL